MASSRSVCRITNANVALFSFFFFYSKGPTPWSHGGCHPIRMYIVLMLRFFSLLLLLLLLPLFGWLLMFSNVEKLYCSSVPFTLVFPNRKSIFSFCMEFEIHDVCHPYSQLLGIDTVRVKVFIVLCNMKQFVVFRRGTLYKSKHKKAPHVGATCVFADTKILHNTCKKKMILIIIIKKKKVKDIFTLNAMLEPQVPERGRKVSRGGEWWRCQGWATHHFLVSN